MGHARAAKDRSDRLPLPDRRVIAMTLSGTEPSSGVFVQARYFAWLTDLEDTNDNAKQMLVVAALGALAIGTSPALAQSGGATNPEAAASEEMAPGAQEQSEREVPLAEVPEAALAAAKGALEGEPKSAHLVTLISGEEVYEIETTSAAGEEVAVYVTPAGEIVESEKEQGEGSE